MTKFEQLISQYCPNGVTFEELGNIVSILDNQRKPISKGNREGGNIPYYGANGIQDYVKDYIFDGTFLLMGEDGSVTNSDGSPILNWATGKIWVNNHAHVMSEIPEAALLRFIYFFLQTINITSIVRGVPPKINQQNLRKILVPIPPLEVQQEVVTILDTFSKLEAELEAELEARQKQYEYYRNELLTFGDEVPMVTLGDCLIRTKGTKITAEQMQQLNKKNAPIKIFAGGKTVAYFNYEDLPENDVQTNPSIIVKSRGLIEFEYYNKPFSHKNEFWAYHSQNKKVEIKYVYYYLKKEEPYFRSIATSMGSLPQISIPITEKFKFHLPSLKEQERIVAILDKFDALVNDISIGLPAEIAARRKQYEYYRNKLLTFKEAA